MSDKWALYLEEYNRLFAPYRELPIRLLEIGVQNGGSLEIWSKYFALAEKLVGCDINPDCAKLTYADPRVAVVVGDANTDQSAAEILGHSPRFDIVIDDGSHRSSDIVRSFARYFSKLNDGGIFVAEDLHCSYWDLFEGGIYDPYSSIAFFKRIADIVNHEHWGIARANRTVLEGIFKHYGCELSEAELGQIHSVEFINSICVVRKAPAHLNRLGERFIAGDIEVVVPGHRALLGSQAESPDQTGNRWSTLAMPPDEEFDLLKAQIDYLHQAARLRDEQHRAQAAVIGQREQEIARLNGVVNEYTNEIGKYHQVVLARDAELEAIRTSSSWRITAPLRRAGGLAPRKLRYRVGGVVGLVRQHGVRNLVGKTWQILRQQGTGGLRQRASLALRQHHLSVGPAIALRHPEANYFPVTPVDRPPLPDVTVDVVLPVYRGLDETRKCIESVLKARCDAKMRVIVIDDASPEPAVSAYLDSLPQTPSFQVLRNEVNLGFVKTVNRGMKLAPANDIVLLNSDTEVADGWLDRLVWHAYSRSKIASVTPFSNNATICSYPTIYGTRVLPSGETLEELNQAFYIANAGRSVELPTGVGFCMYIRRACLDELGLFDEETFGKGYGEENDFCLRAIARGWTHLLAADTLVYHAGEVSFLDTSSPGKARAMEILRERYPDYETRIAEHVTQGDAEPFRIAATAARFRQSGKPVTLMISHHLGGGTEKHLLDLADSLVPDVHSLVLSPDQHVPHRIVLRSASASDSFELPLDLPQHERFLTELLKSFGVSRVHFHHLLGLPDSIQQIVQQLGVGHDFTVHDYYTVCPQVSLTIDGRYCGEPANGGCNACIAKRPSYGAQDIDWWRLKHAWVIDDADRVICPSHDVAQRIRRYRPAARTVVAGHEQIVHVPVNARSLEAAEPLRIVMLGWLATHKGGPLVAECVELARREKRPVHFHLIGRSVDPIAASSVYSETGEYTDENLQSLIAQAEPHLIWLPSTWPETYSYTLSAAIAAGVPVVAPSIGAFPERLSGREWSWVVPWDSTARQMLDFFSEARGRFEGGVSPAAPAAGEAPPEGFYEGLYQAELRDKHARPIDLRRPDVPSVLAVVETYGKHASPCAYIRILLPLMKIASQRPLTVKVVAPEHVSDYVADTVYTHRVALAGGDALTVVEHCRRNNMRLVYDIDDDLLSIAEGDHPEKDVYAAYAQSIRLLASEAAHVHVSTDALRQKMSAFSRHVKLVPNALDGDLWHLGSERSARPANGSVSILYMGTQTHGADFEMVQPALARLKSKYRDRVKISVIGVTQDRAKSSIYEFVDAPARVNGSYAAFAEWLVEQNRFDIGIAPLIDNEFNAGKSGIKFLDYAALGLAAVCSDVRSYRSVVRHEETGLLVRNDENAWFEALDRLVSDRQYRLDLAANGRADLIAYHTLSRAYESSPDMWPI
ncbi:glycosyltransferase [Paraburkholderia sp. BCC1884]|uniref:glycosyltransferase n=1 Tax=Paraburkholderia sp. BCC1884 TaxID=2562668 RepID=UPI0016427518|nr:glycosyltransferase [Paraburkholderia sp. BCC1884]